MWFDFARIREGNERKGLLGHIISPRTQFKESEVKRKVIRRMLKSPREAATVVAITGEHNFISTGRSKILQ